MLKKLIFLLLLLGASISFAQENTEVPAEQTQEAVVVTPETTVEPAPNVETTAIVLPPTEASTQAPTAAPTAFTAPPEPALSLWASDNFEGAISSQWILPADWLGNGTSLSISSTNSAYFSTQSFSELAVQAQFRLVAGASASLFVRNGYRATLTSDGRLSLWRDETELASTNVSINPDGNYLRLSAFGNVLRAGLDGQNLLIVQDSSYSSGFVGVHVNFAQAGLVSLDNFGLWLPTGTIPATAVPSPMPTSNNTITTQALPSPGLLQPTLNQVVAKLHPTFSWQARTGATQYHLRIATNFSCSTAITGGDIFQTGTSYTPNFDIPQGEYWFCVEVQDNTSTWSGFGEKRHFVINLSTAPANQAVITTSTNVNFSWTAITGATYQIEVASDSSFTATTFYPAATNSLTITSQPYGQYYWRVWVNGQTAPASLTRSYYISPALPLAANNAPPLSNGKFSNDTTPVLNWTVPSNWVTPQAGQSITYELQLSTVNTFTSLVGGTSITGIATNSHEWTATALADGRYYWRVRAITNLGLAGAWSAVFNFWIDTAPQAAPNLTAPADTAFVTSARPSFSWASVTGANRYLLEVTQDNSDFDPLVISVTNTTTSFAATSSLAQGQYYWRVWSIDAAGNVSLSPSTVRSFTIDYRTTPTAGQIFVSAIPRTISFKWVLVAGATGSIYTVEIDDDPNFGSIDFTSPLRSTGAWTSPTLNQGRYYWRLNVVGFGTSAARSFVISPALPSAPVLNSPANNAVTNNLSPTLQWAVPTTNAGNITGYELQISTSSSFSTLVGGTISVGTLSYTISPDLAGSAGTIYYWRVRAVTNLGAYGAWSAARNFKIDSQAPLAPTLTAPINAVVITNTLPQLTWQAASGANRYQIRYGLTNDLSAVTPIQVTTTSYTVTTPLILTTYYWQVMALDAAGNPSAWSAVQSFSVGSSNTAAPTNWYFTTTSPTLTWTPIYWAAHYEIQVSNSSSFTSVLYTTTTGDGFTTSATTSSLPSGVYYWRVRAQSPVEAGALWGAWSATESFTIELP